MPAWECGLSHRVSVARPQVADEEGKNVELTSCPSFSFNLCRRGARALYEVVTAMAGADWPMVRPNVCIMVWPSNFSDARDLGVHAIGSVIRRAAWVRRGQHRFSDPERNEEDSGRRYH